MIEGTQPSYQDIHFKRNQALLAYIEHFNATHELRTSPEAQSGKIEFQLRSVQFLTGRESVSLSEEEFFANACTAFWKECTARAESGRGTVRPCHTSEPPRYTAEDVEFAGLVDLAKRGSNGFRLDVIYNLDGSVSEFGKLFNRALENVNLSDHNYWHLRRTEQTLVSFLMNCEILRTEEMKQWIDSAILFANRHDDDQIITLQRNIEGEKLNAKKGHALGGVVMMLVDTERFAYERMISFDEAWKARAGGAFMIMKHDEPESLQSALQGCIDAKGMTGVELSEGYKNNQFDLATLSPSQIISLLMEVKHKNGFMTNGSVYGLSPEYEQEHERELLALFNNHNAILPDFTVFNPDGSKNEKRTALNTMTEACIAADVADMVAPPMQAIYRTLLTQYSLERPFISEDSLKFRSYVNEELIDAHQPPLPMSASFEDYYVALILHGKGNIPSQYVTNEMNLDSDLRRLLFEFNHIMSHGESEFSRQPYVIEFNRVNAICGILAVQEVGRHIIKRDLSIIDASARKEAQQLVVKILSKAGVDAETIFKLESISRGMEDNLQSEPSREILTDDQLDKFMNLAKDTLSLSNSQHSQLSHELDNVIGHIRAVTEKVKKNILAKNSPYSSVSTNEEHILSEKEITEQLRSFEIITSRILQYLISEYGYEGIEEDIKVYRQQMHYQESPWILPYFTYASTASTSRIRTIRKPRHMQFA